MRLAYGEVISLIDLINKEIRELGDLHDSVRDVFADDIAGFKHLRHKLQTSKDAMTYSDKLSLVVAVKG